MKHIGMRLAVLMGALMFLAMAPRLMAGQPDNTTFQVTVKSSFGTTFTDCFRFDVPGTRDLSIDLLGQTITYSHGQLDSVAQRFKAVSRFGQPLSIMYFGEVLDLLEQLTGEAVNEFGDTFVFSGVVNAACTATARSVNPYLDPSRQNTNKN